MEVYGDIVKNGVKVFHGEYCVYHDRYHDAVYSAGAIRQITLEHILNSDYTIVTVYYRNGDIYSWETKWINIYNSQFGVAVTLDGRYVFGQTWEFGLFCLDARTGGKIWRTKSKRGITDIFVNKDTVLCHQHGHALQLLDIHTGEVLAEKRPATAWGFTSLDHNHILCQVTLKRWEIIDAQTLEVKEAFSHKEFTGGHGDYWVNDTKLQVIDGRIRVCGSKSVWDYSVSPPVELPSLEFEYYLESKVLKKLVRE